MHGGNKNRHNKCILFQYVVLSNVKNMIFYTWNVLPILVLWMLLQKSTNKAISRPFHSRFISLIQDSWYFTSICMRPLMLMVHDGMGPHMFLIPKIISTTNVKFQIYFDQLKSTILWVTNQNTLHWVMYCDCEVMDIHRQE